MSDVTLIDKLNHLNGFIKFPEKDFIAVMLNRYHYSSPRGSCIDEWCREKIDKLYSEYSNE